MPQNNQTIATLHNLIDNDALGFARAEIQLSNCMPEWINKAGSLKFKTVLQRYLDFIKQHVQQMEVFFKDEEINAISVSNRVIQAFVDETEEKLSKCSDPEVKDACLLACIQVINHYKISVYGTAAAFANALGMQEQAAIFNEAKINEKQIDDRLSQLAEHEINIKARTHIALPE